ncbi:MAG: malto-oligosyltrehalose synthase, partial [Actinomycetota bacterium]
MRRTRGRSSLAGSRLSSPVAAKGVEDTALYRYHALLSRNEVGDDPAGEAGVDAFHRAMRRRQRSWPPGLTATSTHDSKRGEDVRARLDVLSEIPGEWARRLDRWAACNNGRKTEVAGVPVPDRAEEVLVYQTLLGAWPLDGDERGFRRRLDEYLVKALREARLHTSWTSPDERYEKAVLAFVRSMLAPSNA